MLAASAQPADEFPANALAELPDVGGALDTPVRAAQASTPPATPADDDFLSSVFAARASLPQLAGALDAAARAAVADALGSAGETLSSFEGAESHFARLSLTQPSAATLERLGLTGCYDAAAASPPPFDKDATVELLQNAWASALGELGGLVGSSNAAVEGAARGATTSATAAAAALRASAAEAARVGHAQAQAAAVAMRGAASAELSAVAARLATESAALEQEVAMRASEAFARGTGLAEAALAEANANAAAVLAGASPAQRLAAGVDAAALYVNECAADVLDSLRNDPLSRLNNDFLDAQITLAAASDAAITQANERAAATAAEMRALAAEAMETTAASLESVHDRSVSEFVNSLFAGDERRREGRDAL